MPKFKVNVDEKGNFYTKGVFKLVPPDLGGPKDQKKVMLKLLAPKDVHIKVLTLTINKKTLNVEVSTGKLVTVGPFPMLVGNNDISFEGTSDVPGEVHEFEVTPKLLE